MLARERFDPCTLTVLDGLHNCAMLLSRNRSLALFEVSDTEH
jgi:hypothetical protein